MHPYLRERLRDLKTHGFCIIEHDLAIEDESIWGGYSHDQFDQAVAEHFDGKPYLMLDQPNGDLLIKDPKTQEEMARAIVDVKNAMNQDIDEAAFSNDGLLGNRGMSIR